MFTREDILHDNIPSKKKIDLELSRANIEVQEFSDAIEKITQENPNLKNSLKPIRALAKNIDRSIRRGIIQQEKERNV